MLFLLIPSILHALARYLSFRIHYEGTELVIRSGLVFRNERHVPYARIQNLDGVENVIHRLLGVVDVRVETGGGAEPEARISVLREGSLRRRCAGASSRAARSRPGAAGDSRTDGHSGCQAPTTLLQLSVRDLLLYGLLESRGLVVIGAVYGLLWELGLLDRLWGRLFEDERVGRGLVRSLVRSAFEGAVGSLAPGRAGDRRHRGAPARRARGLDDLGRGPAVRVPPDTRWATISASSSDSSHA